MEKTATGHLPFISQTLIKDVLPQDACPQFIKLRHIDKIEVQPSELMMRGKYFEHHLIGASRGGEVPELQKLKGGGKSQAEKDLDELITWSRIILDELKINLTGAQVQLQLTSEESEESGHLDLVTNDIQQPDRPAIYDVKYTETKYDDRWNGWADFDSMVDPKIQASHYIKLYHAKTGIWVPYYFLVFGKSFWCRVIKVIVTAETISFHNVRISQTRERLQQWSDQGWPAAPEFNKCGKCPFSSGACKSVATVPTIEVHQI